MKLHATAVLAAAATSAAFAGFVPTTTLTASGIAGIGAYDLPANTWTVRFDFDGDLAASSMNADFGNWTLTVSGSNGANWSTSSAEVAGGTWIRSGVDARILTITLADGNPIPGTGSMAPQPTMIEIKYSARKSGSVWESLGSALEYSASPATSADRRGELRVMHGATDQIAGAFVIPAPGAVALVGLAGLIVSRRRA